MTTEPKTTCKACGASILVRTAEATGGYCRSHWCEEARRARVRADQQKAQIDARLNAGELQHCPRCGNVVRSLRIKKHLAEKCGMGPRAHPYARALPHVPVPEWLRRLDDLERLPVPIPLEDVLAESCFYPSSGLDGSPVLLANGCVHSLVYVDYGTTRDAVLRALSSPGFKHYRLLLQRDIQRKELVPEGWTPTVRYWFDDPGAQARLQYAQQMCEPFGVWSIWHRAEGRDERTGPLLFSFLFLGGEALACYDGTYRRMRIHPKIMALIQPGHACGGNWTDFTNPTGPLWQALLEDRAFPEYLLIGGYDQRSSERCPFDGYRHLRTAWTHEPGQARTIDIFRRSVT
jgi:hypothetical protein